MIPFQTNVYVARGFLVSILLLVALHATRLAAEDPLAPTAKIDLHAVTRLPSENRLVGTAQVKRITTGKTLEFLDDSTLAISVVKENAGVSFSNRDESSGGHYSFQTLFFDPISGAKKADRVWSNAVTGMGLLPTHDGEFVIRTGPKITLYSRDFQPLRSTELPSSATIYPPRLTVSPSGMKLFVELMTPPEQARTVITVLDSSTLKPEGSFLVKPYWAAAANDSYFAYSWQDRETGSDLVALRGTDGDSRIIYTSQFGCSSIPLFVARDALFIASTCGTSSGAEIVALKPSGKLIFKHKLTEDIADLCASNDGDAVALLTVKLRGGFFDHPKHVASSRVLIFRRKAQAQLADIPLSTAELRHISQIELSPNGRLLATFGGGIIRVYRIAD